MKLNIVIAIFFLFACQAAISREAVGTSKEQSAAQRTRGCVNSIPGICRIPIYALFSPYSERLYGERVDVHGYLRLMEGVWLLYPDESSAEHAVLERGLLITFDESIKMDEKMLSKKYVRLRGRFHPSSNPMLWAEIILVDEPIVASVISDGPFEPAPPKPDHL